jgi:hypothetical protein
LLFSLHDLVQADLNAGEYRLLVRRLAQWHLARRHPIISGV